MRTISIRLDDHTDAVLATYCRLHGVTQTHAVKSAIERLGSEPRATPAELASRFGLLGNFSSQDGDLAAQHSQRLKAKLRHRLDTESVALSAPATKRKRPSAR